MRMMIALRFLMLFMSRTRFLFFFFPHSLSRVLRLRQLRRINVLLHRDVSSVYKKKNEHTMEMVLFWRENM